MGVEWGEVQLVGAVLDWRNSDSREFMELMFGNCRNEHGRWKGERAIIDLSVDNSKQNDNRK